jgi:hypothetical protein
LRRAAPGIAALLLLSPCWRAAAESSGQPVDIYKITISQARDAEGDPVTSARPVTLTCSSAQRLLSTAEVEIAEDRRHALEATVVAACAGYLHLVFFVDGQFLYVGSQPYAPILVGPSHRARQTIALSAPPPRAHQDSPDGFLHMLVDRLPSGFIGELTVEVEPGP